MEKINLDPYIFFNGNCREAMEFYKGIFGGKLSFSTYGDFKGEIPNKEPLKDMIMHSLLDGEVRLMASDSQQASNTTKKVELSLSGTDETKLRGYWDALAAGGKVRFPLEKAEWGATFGMLTDKYGVDWMVNISQES